MKRIVASVGLLAVGASGVQAATAASLSTGTPVKPWSVSATLRGFYDDNVGTASDGIEKTKSFGFEVKPGFTLNWSVEQTTVALEYFYSFRYYDKLPPGNTEKYDQSHTFNALINHSFTERYLLSVSDSFVIGQEPDVLRTGEAFGAYQRIPGDNIRNYGQIKFNAQLTPLFGTELGYANSLFRYDRNTGLNDDGSPIEPAPTRSGLLNRLEHYVHIDARWTIQPQTIGVLGYRYGQVDYTGDQLIGFDLDTGDPFYSESRNNRSHYAYVGVDHMFRPELTGSVRIGGLYTDYYNEPGTPTSLSPSAQASLSYTYAPESSVSLGLTHDRNATDLFSVENGQLTTDAETTAVFGTLNHRIMPNLYGSVTAQFQNSSLHGGSLDNESERYFLAGLNLEYRFNPHLSTHVGYNYDKLDSEVSGRSFDRNRVYVGVTATY